jgi:hypothetical protein
MQKAIDVFKISIQRARDLGGLHSAMSLVTTRAIDPSDMLRAQIVLIVSALDYLIHEVTAIGMTDIYNGLRGPTDAFSRYRVSADLLIGSSAGNSSAFEADIRERHSFLSFQQPDKIADAIRLFHSEPLWKDVASLLGMTEAALKVQLTLIVGRRNKIAHEADADPSYPGQRWPVTPADASNALDFIEKLGDAIFAALKK